MAPRKAPGPESDAAALRAFTAAKGAENRAKALLRICRRADSSRLDALRPHCGQLVFDDRRASGVFRDRGDTRTYLLKPGQDRYQELPCRPFDELEWVGWLDGVSVYVGRYAGDDRFHALSVGFTADGGEFLYASFGVLKAAAYRALKPGGRWPSRWAWTGRRAAPPAPPPAPPAAPPAPPAGPEPAGPPGDGPRQLAVILAEIAAEVAAAATSSGEAPRGWARAVLDVRWMPGGGGFAAVLKLRDRAGKKLKELLPPHPARGLLREAYLSRTAAGDRWHGLQVAVDRTGGWEVSYNPDPRCAAAADFYD